MDAEQTSAFRRACFNAEVKMMVVKNTLLAKAMEADSGIKLSALKVDGGASANNFLMQFQSDILNTEVRRPRCVETTAMGAAYLAGLAVGYWKDKNDVINNWNIDRKFHPEMKEDEREEKLAGWEKAVKYSFGWAKN
jgi:glycerol kinase